MKRQKGLSLIEIMVAMVIGLILLMALVSLYGLSIRGSATALRSIRLNHDMEAVMNLMVNDIRRAGYWGWANTERPAFNNPFISNNADIKIIGNSCILYSYDANENGSIENNEYYGFRLQNGAIMLRFSRNDPSTADGCNNSGDRWESFTDPDLNITNLVFTPQVTCINTTDNARTCANPNSGDRLIEKRVIQIRMESSLSSDPSISHTLVSNVELRNNRLYIN